MRPYHTFTEDRENMQNDVFTLVARRVHEAQVAQTLRDVHVFERSLLNLLQLARPRIPVKERGWFSETLWGIRELLYNGKNRRALDGPMMTRVLYMQEEMLTRLIDALAAAGLLYKEQQQLGSIAAR